MASDYEATLLEVWQRKHDAIPVLLSDNLRKGREIEAMTAEVERLTRERDAWNDAARDTGLRAERLESALRASHGIIHEGLHGGRATDPEHQAACELPACRRIRQALDGGVTEW